MKPRTTIAWAIASFRGLDTPPERARSTVIWFGSAPGLVTTIRSEKTSSSTCDPVIAYSRWITAFTSASRKASSGIGGMSSRWSPRYTSRRPRLRNHPIARCTWSGSPPVASPALDTSAARSLPPYAAHWMKWLRMRGYAWGSFPKSRSP